MFVGAMLALYAIVRRFQEAPPEWAWRIASYAIGGVASFWMIERVVGFWE